MAWFFVQVWVLCLVAFLLGAAVTWLAFVRPSRRARGPDAVGWPELTAWPEARPATEPLPPEPEVEPETAAGPPTNPALAALDLPGPSDGRPTVPGRRPRTRSTDSA